jgi:Domain of unknown function (DUF4160)
VIKMFYNDHPAPHFHVEYGEHKARYTIAPIGVLSGVLPTQAHRLVMEWAAQHQAELQADWTLARANRRPARIAPLE